MLAGYSASYLSTYKTMSCLLSVWRFYCHHTSNALFAFVIGFLPGSSQPHRPDPCFGTPLFPTAASPAACAGFRGRRCFKFFSPHSAVVQVVVGGLFRECGLSSCLCLLRTNGSCIGSHSQLTNRAMVTAGWRRRDDISLPVFCIPHISVECALVRTQSSKQRSLVLHELSIKQDVVQLRLEADWLEINCSRLFLWIYFPPVVHFESSRETENLNVFCKYAMSPYL